MSTREKLLIETAWLSEHLGDPNIRIVDMRGYVRTTPIGPGREEATYVGAAEDYAVGHIPGAVYIDWTKDIVDLTDPVPVQIAPPEKFAAKMGKMGIGDDTFVIAYDAHPAMQFSTRLWWALRYYGHDNAAILNGGFPKWQREGRPLTTEAPTYASATFTPQLHPELRATAEEVLAQLHTETTLVDARDAAQFSGQKCRGNGRSGHIPGAINVPREALVDPVTGTFLSNESLQQAFEAAGIPHQGKVIAYCNGGVAATSVLFALAVVDHEQLVNFDGSWNEWGERQELPVE